MTTGLPEASMPVTMPTCPPVGPRLITAMAPTCGPETRTPSDANELAMFDPVVRYPALSRTRFINAAHHKLLRLVGLVPMYRRASTTMFEGPNNRNSWAAGAGALLIAFLWARAGVATAMASIDARTRDRK